MDILATRFEYLIFNVLVFLGPFLGYFFYPKAVGVNLKAAIVSIGITAGFFVAWDMIVSEYFWSFNFRYVLGYKLLTIPVEEVMFFFTVPLACLVLYVNFVGKIKAESLMSPALFKTISFFLLALGLVFGYFGKLYTSVVFGLLGAIWLLDVWICKTCLVAKSTYWQFMLVVVILTSVFNYYLTSRPVVLYNNDLNLNYRFLTIPVEDYVYAISLISLTLVLYEFVNFRVADRQ